MCKIVAFNSKLMGRDGMELDEEGDKLAEIILEHFVSYCS